MKRVDVVVGPNGAGKSTFVAVTLAPLLPGCAFVNADEIAKQRWPEDAAAHSYDAARIAAETRATLIEMGRPFIAETVFSHPSKLDLIHDAHAAGYTVVVHALLIPVDLAVHRVRHLRRRHQRLWPLIADALGYADIASVYDNSRHQGPRIVARFNSGMVLGSPAWPEWTPPPLPQRWPR